MEYRTSHNMLTGEKRLGDRKDGELIRQIDPMHFITPIIYPNRCDNEAYISERVAYQPLVDWCEKANETIKAEAALKGDEPPFLFTPFHLITACLLKTIELRPKLNRFIANKSFYQRKYLSAAFVVKKGFSDEAEEALAFLYADPDDTIFTLHEKLREQITACRSDELDESSNSMDILNKMPRFLSRFLLWIVTRLDVHGKVPMFLIGTDPYYSSCLLSNLGSIKLKSGYHHLTNWGTMSLFCIIGEKKMTPSYGENGLIAMEETIDLGITIDERLADGYYYSKSIRLLKKLLANPSLLEEPLAQNVDFE